MPGYPRPLRGRPCPLRELADITSALEPAGNNGTQLADGTDGTQVADYAKGTEIIDGTEVTGVSHASSGVRPGDLYAALPGARRHGAEFAGEAVAAGAVAILTDPAGAALLGGPAAGVPVLVVPDPRAILGAVSSRVYGDPTARLPVLGITGTAGKTSTAYLIESGLHAAGHTTCLIGTVETRLAGEVVPSERTTPEATDLHALFATALERGATAAVMEVSSHALAYGRVGGVRFAVGGYTNFGLDHLDFHRDVRDYFDAKARLFDGRCAVEVLNADDPALEPLRKAATITYSAAGDPNATWYATDVRDDGYGQRFTAHGPAGISQPAAVALPGRHNVANALLALAALTALGIDPAVAAQGVAACPGVPGRLERVDAPGPVTGVVDYGHKPDAIVEVLATLRRRVREGGQLIAVLGAGGDRDRGKRPLMGAAAARGADVVIVTDDNPRTEDPARIRAEVLAGAHTAGAHTAAGRTAAASTAGANAARASEAHATEAGAKGTTVTEVAGRRDAIVAAVALAGPGDVVVLLGKGHETGQEVAGTVHPFDDRVELAAALTQRAAMGAPA